VKGKVTSANIKVIDGNTAAAYGVMLCKPEVIATYPITPQTQILEHLFDFKNKGLLNAEIVVPESEHSAMSIVCGASGCGARTFTATASQGLAFMYEARICASTSRLPIVMVNVNREVVVPRNVTSGEQDIMMARVDGWIHIHVESCQEILDSIIMAYRLAEDLDINVPVVVCYDGYFLSHLWDAVEIPDQETVDSFLPPRQTTLRVDPKIHMTFSSTTSGLTGTKCRYGHSAALQRAKAKIDEIDQEFQQVFGRSYGGQIEGYRVGDADTVLVALGSCVGTARVVIDKMRNEGLKVGLVKVRAYRPFPNEKLLDMLKGKKAIGVIERNIAFGMNFGALYVDLRSVLYELGTAIPMLGFVCGLCGLDITEASIERAINAVNLAAEGKPYNKVTWLDLE